MYTRKKVKGGLFIGDLSHSVLLDYFITQKKDEYENPQPFFGIEIEKYILENDVKKLAEAEHSGFFSQSLTFATDMAIMLADNLVTPVTLNYILDDNLND